MKQYNLLLGIAIVAISLTAITCFAALADGVEGVDGVVHDGFTPSKGTHMRKEILEALRKEVKGMHKNDVIFVVEYLKVLDGWAWIHTLPRSGDGTSRYEDISALLELQNNKWKVIELPCVEVDNPECIDDPAYFIKLKKRYPKIPNQILPEE